MTPSDSFAHSPNHLQDNQLIVTSEWLSTDSIRYVTASLDACENANMLADLRQIFPRQVLKEASRYVRGVQRQRLQEWLTLLNR